MTEDEVVAVFVREAGPPPLPGEHGPADARALRGRSSTSTTATPRRSGTGAATGEELFERLHALPGYGDEKARIFVAILGKRMGVRPPGWQKAATAVRRPRAALRRRHRLAGLTGAGPALEEGPEGRPPRQAGPQDLTGWVGSPSTRGTAQ